MGSRPEPRAHQPHARDAGRRRPRSSSSLARIRSIQCTAAWRRRCRTSARPRSGTTRSGCASTAAGKPGREVRDGRAASAHHHADALVGEHAGRLVGLVHGDQAGERPRGLAAGEVEAYGADDRRAGPGDVDAADHESAPGHLGQERVDAVARSRLVERRARCLRGRARRGAGSPAARSSPGRRGSRRRGVVGEVGCGGGGHDLLGRPGRGAGDARGAGGRRTPRWPRGRPPMRCPTSSGGRRRRGPATWRWRAR